MRGATACELLFLAACGARTDIGAPGTAAPACTPADVDDLPTVGSLTVDERDFAYWISGSRDVARYDGTDATVLVHYTDDYVTALALDGDHLVYTLESGTLAAVPRDGGEPVTIGWALPFTFASDMHVRALEPRSDGSFVIVGGDAADQANVVVVDAGGAVQEVWFAPFRLVAAAADASFAYVAMETGDNLTSIARVDVAAGTATTLADGFQNVAALALDATQLYVLSQTYDWKPAAKWPAGVLVMPTSGGEPAVLFTPAGSYDTGAIAIDATGVYASTSTKVGDLWKVRLDGEATHLAGWQGDVVTYGGIALGPRAVHFVVTHSDGTQGVHELCK